MAEFLSAQHAVNSARLVYENFKFKLGEKSPGQHVSAEASVDTSSAKLGALFALIDEFVFILRYLCHYFTSCVPVPENHHSITHLRFCTGTLSTLWSIRTLSSIGLDLNARSQLRYLYELVVLWSRIQVDPEALQAFENTASGASNAFWHRFLARRRSETFLRRPIAEGGVHWLGRLENLDDIYKRLGLSAHPGLWGLHFETASAFKETEGWASRGPNAASHFTLASSLFLTMLPFTVNNFSEWSYRAVPIFDPHRIEPALLSASSWDEYCRELRRVLLGIGLLALNFSNQLKERKLSSERQVEPE